MSPEAAIRDELTAHGAIILRVEHGGKHPRIVFRHKGRERFYVVPGSASDRRAHLNARRDIRHMLGVKRQTNKNPDRKRKQRTGKPLLVPTLTSFSFADPFEALKDHPVLKATPTCRCGTYVSRLRQKWAAIWHRKPRCNIHVRQDATTARLMKEIRG